MFGTKLVQIRPKKPLCSMTHTCLFLSAQRTLCRRHLEHILISGVPQNSTLLIHSTCLTRQSAQHCSHFHLWMDPLRLELPHLSFLEGPSKILKYLKSQLNGSTYMPNPVLRMCVHYIALKCTELQCCALCRIALHCIEIH